MNKPQLSVVYSKTEDNNNARYNRTEIMNKPDPSLVIFNQLLLSLFHYIDREQHGLGLKTKVYLYDKLGHMFLPEYTRDAFRNYLLANRPLNLTGAIDESLMREIIQLLYEKMCSLFGPINADTYLKRAMADIDRLPEAKFFNPGELL